MAAAVIPAAWAAGNPDRVLELESGQPVVIPFRRGAATTGLAGRMSTILAYPSLTAMQARRT